MENKRSSFDGVFTKTIDFEYVRVDVTYNPYTDDWEFKVKGSTVSFDGAAGKMVYELLSTMKWAEEVEVEKRKGGEK